MRNIGKALMLVFPVLLLLGAIYPVVAQEPHSTLAGTVIGIRSRLWLDVESEKDRAVVNFRIGRKTVYTPHRYPYVGEKVRVEYLTQRGVPVALTVTILEGSKEGPKEGAGEKSKESPK